MPVLSFPCVVRPVGRAPAAAPSHTWIKGHDFRSLAVAAPRRLGAPPECCRYAVRAEESASSGAVLSVTHASRGACVGPMAAPLPATRLADGAPSSLDDLLAALNLSACGHNIDDDEANYLFRHLVPVTYAPVSRQTRYPGRRRPFEIDADYRARLDRAERLRLERTRRQGIHVVTYAVPPEEWTARDLELLLVQAYHLLPTDEPRWRESGRIAQETFTDPHDPRRATLAYALQVGRGDYVAHVRLPAFPTSAFADWVASRRCEVNLRAPVMKLEFLTRGWRGVEASRSRPHGMDRLLTLPVVREAAATVCGGGHVDPSREA